MATVGIISIGEMGLGIGQLLKAHGVRVVTKASDRRHAGRITSTAQDIKKKASRSP
jgi:predicted dinucleotide-binding enzyme